MKQLQILAWSPVDCVVLKFLTVGCLNQSNINLSLFSTQCDPAHFPALYEDTNLHSNRCPFIFLNQKNSHSPVTDCKAPEDLWYSCQTPKLLAPHSIVRKNRHTKETYPTIQQQWYENSTMTIKQPCMIPQKNCLISIILIAYLMSIHYCVSLVRQQLYSKNSWSDIISTEPSDCEVASLVSDNPYHPHVPFTLICVI